MALSEQTAVESIEVLEDEGLIVKEVTRVLRDGVEVARTERRAAFMPGDPIEAQAPKLRALAALLWTPAVVAARRDAMAAAEAAAAERARNAR